eukprot:CAMPEP_0179107200 /NCGR_PEP_ID=MMETSP0796-20121207/49882_1 /TAXON_ID=73915 /ORGANISM="Pyrodinium bahamense, Strain pbaha01" /LENGTH=183 /DNA_ID=CAMNT_0020805253 /DNA_START=34 /DNA_END=586 /DNA_ORIENTATION=+
MSMGGPPPNVRDMFSVKIDNLSTKTDKFELRDAFAKFGTVGDVFIPWDEQRQPRSYGFVRFLERRHAEDAVAAMDGRDFGGSEIRCQLAASEKPLNLPIRGGDCEDDAAVGGGATGAPSHGLAAAAGTAAVAGTLAAPTRVPEAGGGTAGGEGRRAMRTCGTPSTQGAKAELRAGRRMRARRS